MAVATDVIDLLNDLLARERGEVEAIKMVLSELSKMDPDLADTARDVLSTSSWSCSGLYHRIVQLDGTPTLDATNLAEQMTDMEGPQIMIEFLCSEQVEDEKRIRSVIKGKGLDKTTREFLNELLQAHEQTHKWCESTLLEWEPDI